MSSAGVITTASGITYRQDQIRGDDIHCGSCGQVITDAATAVTNHDGIAFCNSVCILADHDRDETLHPYVEVWQDAPGAFLCGECGDTAEGLMHNNTERNIEPLLWEGE